MQHSGILRNWNDEKGFGFIAPSHGGAELFVHISAFPRDGSRPTAGETISYEIGQGKNGKTQAVRVVRRAVGLRKSPPGPIERPSITGKSLAGTAALLVLLMALGVHGINRYKSHAHRAELERMNAVATPAPSQMPLAQPNQALSASAFHCDGRTHCSQMTSCQEATWFVNHCPGTQMDGNHDGVPCEQQWCTAPGSRP